MILILNFQQHGIWAEPFQFDFHFAWTFSIVQLKYAANFQSATAFQIVCFECKYIILDTECLKSFYKSD